MKKILYSVLLLMSVMLLPSCQKDLMEDVKDGDWNQERNIIDLAIHSQIGPAVIERNIAESKIKVYGRFEQIEDLSKVEITNILLSYGATTSNSVGTFLDFSNEDTTAVISVVPENGESMDWEVSLKSFKSDLEGTWYIGEIGMYCDMFTWESWGWEKYVKITDYLPELNPELDNVFSFTVEGADENGNPYGSFEHTAGNDGAYGNFGDAGKGWDFNARFRHMPMGTGTWTRDFIRNKVIVKDSNGKDYEFDFELFTETNEVSLKVGLEYLSSQFNWTDTDWSYEELAHMSNPMWYKFTRDKIVQTGNDMASLMVKDQVGGASIDVDNKVVTILIEDNGADVSAIEITGLSTSYAASANMNVGDLLDFSTNNDTQITVTSEAGESATWTIKLQIDLDVSDISIAGTWTIGQIGIYSDLFTWESWGWDKSEQLNNYLSGAGAELDNTITFTVEGANSDGLPYGTYENNSGTDGQNGNFVSDDATWPESDFNSRFRRVPTGTGSWVLNEEVVTIKDSEGTEYELKLEVKTGTEIALSAQLPYYSELFSWDNTNYSYEEVAHMSNKIWYNLSK